MNLNAVNSIDFNSLSSLSNIGDAQNTGGILSSHNHSVHGLGGNDNLLSSSLALDILSSSLSATEGDHLNKNSSITELALLIFAISQFNATNNIESAFNQDHSSGVNSVSSII